MVVRRAYKRVKVNSVERANLAAIAKVEKAVVLGLDVAKGEIVASLRWHSEVFERPWSVANPSEIKTLVDLCSILVAAGLDLKVAMESTGTYGDSVRYAMTAAKIQVLRVSGKNVCDYKEIFDGVSSQHDGKDAAMIAELCSLGKATEWPFALATEFMAEVSLLVRRVTFQAKASSYFRLARVTRTKQSLRRFTITKHTNMNETTARDEF
jgi:transposase